MSEIEDFTANEIEVVEHTLKERYGKSIPVELADTEIRLDPSVPVLTTCPALYWEDTANNAHFIICKLGKMQYHSQFFYRGNEQFGTGVYRYDDLHTCVVTTLRVQADHKLSQDKIVKT